MSFGTAPDAARADAAQWRGLVGPAFGLQTARHVRPAAVVIPGQLLKFGRQLALPAQDFQTYTFPGPDGQPRTIRMASGDPSVDGATYVHQGRQQGVNFSVFSRNAKQVDLCLFNSPSDPKEVARIPLKASEGGQWHGFSPDLQPGQLYGFRVSGEYKPQQGHRFNPNKLLLDSRAKAIARPIQDWDARLTAFKPHSSPNDPDAMSPEANAAVAPLSVVVDDRFNWGQDARPQTPWNKTLIYEAHVKGMTALHPLVPKELRGTYAGLATKPVIQHLKDLGVTTVELLPVQYFANDQKDKGRANYWGYSTLGFLAPQPEYATAAAQADPQGPVREFKQMVKTLHANDLEVMLDVVYNHTGEGNEHGPSMMLRGLDNQSYYREVPGQDQYYMDYTGCGNTLDSTHPATIKLILDSLRYWVEEMHVDGFRFDLASALVRDANGNIPVNMLDHPLFRAIAEDPVLSKVKLVAEPWDSSMDGYKVGGFPQGWSEWNGRYRDDMRKFWQGQPGMLSAFANRLTGSSDLYGASNRGLGSVNFITAHDGYTMKDLTAYEQKHNWENGENNRDGENNNHSRNFGVEGPTDNAEINARRSRQIKNFWATLLLSRGVPMVLHGDELGRTQNGNNNAYCQDNELSWVHWDQADQNILDFAKTVTKLRREHPVFHRAGFVSNQPFANGRKAMEWVRMDGQRMTDQDWNTPYAQSIGVMIDGDAPDLDGKDEHFLLLANSSEYTLPFTLPAHAEGSTWTQVFDTAGAKAGKLHPAGQSFPLAPGSMALFKMKNPD